MVDSATPGSWHSNYVPDWGHIVWLDFDPQSGYEQAGRRPALVLSRAAYNSASSLAFLCPITSQVKGHPLEVTIPEGLQVKGVVLPNHLKSLDWRTRNASYLCDLPQPQVLEVIGKIVAILR
jgi:mRNA interferase MazF